MFYRNGFELEACLRMLPFKWYMSQSSKMFITREIMHKLRGFRYKDIRSIIISNFKQCQLLLHPTKVEVGLQVGVGFDKNQHLVEAVCAVIYSFSTFLIHIPLAL